MYIAETTAKERLTIDHATSGIFGNLERAHRMLCRLWEDNFGAAGQKDISAYRRVHAHWHGPLHCAGPCRG